MSSSSALLTKTTVQYTLREITDWLQAQSQRFGFEVVLYEDEAEMKSSYFYIPAYLPGGKDAYDYALKLQKLEDAWNDQEPRPEPSILLMPAKSPIQNAVWERLWKSRDRKNAAADAVAEAVGEEEQQALTELRAARAAEAQAEKDYDELYQLKR